MKKNPQPKASRPPRRRSRALVRITSAEKRDPTSLERIAGALEADLAHKAEQRNRLIRLRDRLAGAGDSHVQPSTPGQALEQRVAADSFIQRVDMVLAAQVELNGSMEQLLDDLERLV